MIALPRASGPSGFIATLERKGIGAQALLSPMGQAKVWSKTMTTYRLERAEADLFRVFYRAHGRLYCLRNEGGYARRNLVFYACNHAGEPRYALGFIPEPEEFDEFIEP